MNKKKILIVITIIAALIVPFSVFAATSDVGAAKRIRGFLGIDFTKLNDRQKADVNDYTQKLADLQKDFINKMIANGTITKEQGDAEISKIDDMLKNGTENGIIPGFGNSGKGFGGRGNPGGMGLFGIDPSKLTEQQKTDLNASFKSMADLQKELINKLVANGLMTKAQGDSSISRIDEILSEVQKNGITKGAFMLQGLGGVKCFGLKGIDESTLTEQQKADLKDFSTKMTALQKDLVNKMVTNGALTNEQGDAAIKAIDNMANALGEKGFENKRFGMKRGGFGGPGRHGSPKAESTSTYES